jgi:hypothetical protein
MEVPPENLPMFTFFLVMEGKTKKNRPTQLFSFFWTSNEEQRKTVQLNKKTDLVFMEN